MAIESLDEHEQSERVRAWLKDNASNMLTGVALGVAMIAGWHWWQNAQSEHQTTAAVQFNTLIEAASAKESDSVDAIAQSLRTEFADTPYALLAGLRVARVKIDAGEPQAARDALAAIDVSDQDQALAALVALRIARLDLTLDKPTDALATLQSISSDFGGLVDEARGDALTALDRADDARLAYQKALTVLDGGSPVYRTVQMKLDNLGVAAKPEV
ncbi:MAG: tetratricopeptide repeat protein [Xanthomonadaceae bacterium]|nr:tetratricopeptide repeat protein [Xanthomonadaceae bacterium]MDP2185686.1 tetratricopeptide repeat protein [Xanthomonadales bacterium]MDZ4116610.1 tetratricopeptide repeat protein [Xanthomonadaceae bacterium]MDZ4378301.1 tetratricopeptide repeat protein [Xanthomonadaceae bacterium]